MIVPEAQKRPLSTIAEDIQEHWPKVWYGAEPYLEAMGTLNLITDHYFEDTAESVVRYFLSNTMYWRGPEAKRIKDELWAMAPKGKP